MSEREAAIWIVTLPDAATPDAHAWAVLSDAERSRAGRFRTPADRAAYVHGHAALRALIERRIEQPLHRRPFDVLPSGKPWLSGSPLGFSYSRSRLRAAVALLDEGDIGVDIEAVVPDETSADVARASFPAGDVEWLMQAGGDRDRLRRFYRLWVIREAVLKADGSGLTRPLAEVEIKIDGDALSLADESRWTVFEPPSIEGYAAAAAIPRRCSVTCQEIRWSDLRSG
jgi:4'-phosphopantetheinyl transferase